MKWLCNVLSWHFTCLAAALVILSVLAMSPQGVRANDPSPDGGFGGYCPTDCIEISCNCSCTDTNGYEVGCSGGPDCPCPD
jgi:hypothetical protein